MAINFRSFATDSMPERLQVTQDLERRFKEQEAAKQLAKLSAQQTPKSDLAPHDRP
jgi:hypothetical protein